MTEHTNREELSKLPSEQIKILKVWLDTDSDYCFPYRTFERYTGLDLKTLKHHMKQLRDRGLVYYARGLMNEDGQVAGSGHGIEYHTYTLINDMYEEEIEKKHELDTLLYNLQADKDGASQRLVAYIDQQLAKEREQLKAWVTDNMHIGCDGFVKEEDSDRCCWCGERSFNEIHDVSRLLAQLSTQKKEDSDE